MEIKNFYDAEPFVRAVEEIDLVKEPLVKLLNNIKDDYHTPRIKLLDGQKTYAKFYNKDVAETVIQGMIDGLDNMKKDCEKKLKRI